MWGLLIQASRHKQSVAYLKAPGYQGPGSCSFYLVARHPKAAAFVPRGLSGFLPGPLFMQQDGACLQFSNPLSSCGFIGLNHVQVPFLLVKYGTILGISALLYRLGPWHRDKQPAQSHTASKWQRRNSDPKPSWELDRWHFLQWVRFGSSGHHMLITKLKSNTWTLES